METNKSELQSQIQEDLELLKYFTTWESTTAYLPIDLDFAKRMLRAES